MIRKNIFALLTVLLTSHVALAQYNYHIGRFHQPDPLGTGPRIVHSSNGPQFVNTHGPTPPRPDTPAPVYQKPVPRPQTPVQVNRPANPVKNTQTQTADPQSQYADGMNLYQYVNSNPVNYVDPYGLFKKFICCSPTQQNTLTANEKTAQSQITSLKQAINTAIAADTGQYPWFTKQKLENSLKILDKASVKLKEGKAKCEIKGSPLAWAMPWGDTVHICPPYWNISPNKQAATLVHEGTHMGAGTTDAAYFYPNEKPHDVLIFGYDIIASTYDTWILSGFCIPGYNCK